MTAETMTAETVTAETTTAETVTAENVTQLIACLSKPLFAQAQMNRTC